MLISSDAQKQILNFVLKNKSLMLISSDAENACRKRKAETTRTQDKGVVWNS